MAKDIKEIKIILYKYINICKTYINFKRDNYLKIIFIRYLKSEIKFPGLIDKKLLNKEIDNRFINYCVFNSVIDNDDIYNKMRIYNFWINEINYYIKEKQKLKKEFENKFERIFEKKILNCYIQSLKIKDEIDVLMKNELDKLKIDEIIKLQPLLETDIIFKKYNIYNKKRRKIIIKQIKRNPINDEENEYSEKK